ncbi:hypothetical protein [Rhodoferax sediminis]|jgi:hypothetical protein|uniref:Uncharacterized protein n=1 Tax=Rhodoferax sediminis TaxID=2509614 RepID=A0A515D8B4_9BURK|nr:hypothetical protein [Rhodoferax sediminis]QDL36636.1 hypothetical protein EUB48_04500 [Rhodoferax sediminis]
MNLKQAPLSRPAGWKSVCLAAVFLGVASSMLPMSVGAGQGSASFQISLRIVARPPAPQVSQQVISAGSPGYPPHPMFKSQVMIEQKSGDKFIILKTEF